MGDLYDKGMGMIASKDINPSEIILSDQSVLRETKHEDNNQKYKLLIDSYNSCNEFQKEQIMNLSNCFSVNSNRNKLINIYYTNCIKIENNLKFESGLFPNIAR